MTRKDLRDCLVPATLAVLVYTLLGLALIGAIDPAKLAALLGPLPANGSPAPIGPPYTPFVEVTGPEADFTDPPEIPNEPGRPGYESPDRYSRLPGPPTP